MATGNKRRIDIDILGTTNDDLRAGWPSGRLSSHAEAPRTYRAAKAVTAREPREKRVPVSNVPLDKPAEDAPLVPEDIERPR